MFLLKLLLYQCVESIFFILGTGGAKTLHLRFHWILDISRLVFWLTVCFAGCGTEEKLLGSDVQRSCQTDELWQKRQTNGETGHTLLEDDPVWYAEDQKSWFANFCIALKRPWNDTMDREQQTGRQSETETSGWVDVTAEVNVLNADKALHDLDSMGNIQENKQAVKNVWFSHLLSLISWNSVKILKAVGAFAKNSLYRTA